MILKARSSAASTTTPWCIQGMAMTPRWAPNAHTSRSGASVAGKPDSPSRPPKVTGSRSGEIVVELPESPELGRYAAAALVFGASASVLVVEVVALRLLAPYLGLTLETSTLVIGVALAAIALGSWAGGRVPDLMPPRRALGPLRAVSGGAVAAPPFAVRAAGAIDDGVLLIVSTFAIMVQHAPRCRHAYGHQVAADQPQQDRNGRRKALGDRHRGRHRRHRRDRFHPHLTSAGQRHHGRAWRSAGPSRGCGGVGCTWLAVGSPSGGARSSRWRCGRSRTW